jgi:hypothetical protein
MVNVFDLRGVVTIDVAMVGSKGGRWKLVICRALIPDRTDLARIIGVTGAVVSYCLIFILLMCLEIRCDSC